MKSDKEALQDIVDGKYDSLPTEGIGSILDDIAARYEALGIDIDSDPLLNAAADHLTKLLIKRAELLLT